MYRSHLRTRMTGLLLLTTLQVLSVGTVAWAQEPSHNHTTAPEQADGTWQWTLAGNVFVGANLQERKFRDFHAVESQNWFMATAVRATPAGSVRLSSMASLEPFTLRRLGSAQVFQTGETYRNAPLIDYQHPHDLVMELGADLTRHVGVLRLTGGADLVGAPTLGPVAFMHRPSADENPQVPLSHHQTDATHITHGVVRGGIGAGRWLAEASWFHGREPDEDRLGVEFGRLDSGAIRVSWKAGGWSTQASVAALTQPEAVTPYDAKRVTASVSYASPGEVPRLAWLALFGQNREIHGNLEAYLIEATWRPGADTAFYTRLESVAKDILDVGFHPRGVFHRHRQSQIGAITLGYTRSLVALPGGPLSAGVDVTGYLVPGNLHEAYGTPVSIHVFVRHRLSWPRSSAPHVHGGP